jgi:hypothetical protein
LPRHFGVDGLRHQGEFGDFGPRRFGKKSCGTNAPRTFAVGHAETSAAASTRQARVGNDQSRARETAIHEALEEVEPIRFVLLGSLSDAGGVSIPFVYPELRGQVPLKFREKFCTSSPIRDGRK